MTYDAASVRTYFDTFAEREWERLETTLQGRSNYAVHKRFLDEHARPGMTVLDIGSGPGRFAIDLVASGAAVTLADVSQVQLGLARARLEARGMLERVAGFQQLDVVNMTSIGDASFDMVVCFGGVLSYTRERHVEALQELARVVRPGGVVLLSVMSLHGALRLIGPLDAAAVVESIDDHLDWQSVLSGANVVYTRTGSVEFHQPIVLFTSIGLRAAVEEAGLRVEGMASANPILPQYLKIPRIEESAAANEAMQRLEVTLCTSPGLLDAGGHLLAVARRPA